MVKVLNPEGLKEKNIIVKGTVTTYKDKPQIIVSDIKNLTILPN